MPTLIETEIQKYSPSLLSAPELDGLQQWDGAKLFRVRKSDYLSSCNQILNYTLATCIFMHSGSSLLCYDLCHVLLCFLYVIARIIRKIIVID